MALLVPGTAVGEVVVVGAEVVKTLDVIVVFLVGGKLVAWKFCVVLQHKAAELAVDEDVVAVAEVRSWDIEARALAEVLLGQDLASGDLACVVGDHVVVGHCEDCI